MKRTFALLLILLLTAAPQAPLACSVCGCGDPLQSAGSVPPLPGGFRLSLQTDYLTATAASDDNPEQTESLTQRGVSGTVMYGPTASLSLIAIVPFVSKDWKLTGGGEAPESASPTGLGDINVGARYYLMETADYHTMRSQFIAVTAGSTLPTGRENDQVDGQRIDQHAQLGTGSWGPYVGLTYVLRSDLWNLTANVNGTTRSTNSYAYRFGDALRWGVEGQMRLGSEFAVSLAGEGRYAKRDVADGDAQLNTGGTVLDLTPGVSWSPSPTVGLYARAQIPVFTDLYGEQTVGTTFQIGMQLLVQ
jgi:Putative MetA-pathway of phenol degradation